MIQIEGSEILIRGDRNNLLFLSRYNDPIHLAYVARNVGQTPPKGSGKLSIVGIELTFFGLANCF